MNAATTDWAQVLDALGAIRQELAQLGERVAALEAAGGAKPAAAAPAAPPKAEAEAEPEGLSEELLLVLSAAIAAFLGKKPHIRQIRLLSTAAWAQQGRATIQASHALPVHYGETRSPR
jgi:methylmalonyl-CoA carboxyltransferase large subunit